MAKFIIKENTQRFDKMLYSSMATSILFAILGVIMLVVPELTNALIGILVGILFIVSGANTIVKYVARDGAKLYSFNIIFGIVLAITGVILMLSPTAISSFITICFGIYLIVFGANKVTYGVWFKIGDDSSWLITLVIGIFIIALGFLVILNPFKGAMTITKVVGTFLILSSVLDLTDLVLLKRRSKEVSKIFW